MNIINKSINDSIDVCGYCGEKFNIAQMKELSLGSEDKIYFYSCKYCVEILNNKYKVSSYYEILLIE